MGSLHFNCAGRLAASKESSMLGGAAPWAPCARPPQTGECACQHLVGACSNRAEQAGQPVYHTPLPTSIRPHSTPLLRHDPAAVFTVPPGIAAVAGASLEAALPCARPAGPPRAGQAGPRRAPCGCGGGGALAAGSDTSPSLCGRRGGGPSRRVRGLLALEGPAPHPLPAQRGPGPARHLRARCAAAPAAAACWTACLRWPPGPRFPLTSRCACLRCPGFGANADHWRKNLPELGRHCRAFAVDLLGYGYSDKPASPEPNSLYIFPNWSALVGGRVPGHGEGVHRGNTVMWVAAWQHAGLHHCLAGAEGGVGLRNRLKGACVL